MIETRGPSFLIYRPRKESESTIKSVAAGMGYCPGPVWWTEDILLWSRMVEQLDNAGRGTWTTIEAWNARTAAQNLAEHLFVDDRPAVVYASGMDKPGTQRRYAESALASRHAYLATSPPDYPSGWEMAESQSGELRGMAKPFPWRGPRRRAILTFVAGIKASGPSGLMPKKGFMPRMDEVLGEQGFTPNDVAWIPIGTESRGLGIRHLIEADLAGPLVASSRSAAKHLRSLGLSFVDGSGMVRWKKPELESFVREHGVGEAPRFSYEQ